MTDWNALAQGDPADPRVWPIPTDEGDLVAHLAVSHGGTDDEPPETTHEDRLAWHEMVHADDENLQHSHSVCDWCYGGGVLALVGREHLCTACRAAIALPQILSAADA